MYNDDLDTLYQTMQERSSAESELQDIHVQAEQERDIQQVLDSHEIPADIDEILEDASQKQIATGEPTLFMTHVINKVVQAFGGKEKDVSQTYLSPENSAKVNAIQQATGDAETTPYADESYREGTIQALRQLSQQHLLTTAYAKEYMKRGLTFDEAYDAAKTVVHTDIEKPEHSAEYLYKEALRNGEYGKALWEMLRGNWVGLTAAGIGGAGYGMWRAGTFSFSKVVPFLMSKAGVASVGSAVGAELMATPAVEALDRRLYDSPWLNLAAQFALGGTAIAKGEDILASTMKADKYRKAFFNATVQKGAEKELKRIAHMTMDPAITTSMRTRIYDAVYGGAKKVDLEESERLLFEKIVGPNSEASAIEDLQTEVRDMIAARISSDKALPQSKSYIKILESRKAKLSKRVADLMDGYRKHGPEDPGVSLEQQPAILRAKLLGRKIQQRLEFEQSKTKGARRYKKVIQQIVDELTPANLLSKDQAESMVAGMHARADEAAMKAEVAAEEAAKLKKEFEKTAKEVGDTDNLTKKARKLNTQRKYEEAAQAVKDHNESSEYLRTKAIEKQLEADAASRPNDVLADVDMFSPEQKKLDDALATASKQASAIINKNYKPIHDTLSAFVESSSMPDAQKTEMLTALKAEAEKLLHALADPSVSNKARREAYNQLKELKIL